MDVDGRVLPLAASLGLGVEGVDVFAELAVDLDRRTHVEPGDAWARASGSGYGKTAERDARFFDEGQPVAGVHDAEKGL